MRIDKDFHGKLAEQLRKHEGLRLKPYHCPAGKLTIGIGRNLEDKGISEKEAVQLVLVDMRFNLGPGRFRHFKKMIAAVNDQDFGRAAAEMKDSRWYTQVGQRARTLVKIRAIFGFFKSKLFIITKG